MTLTDSDLSELLAALKAGEVTDTVRSSLEWILQQLIEAEATAFIGAARHGSRDRRANARPSSISRSSVHAASRKRSRSASRRDPTPPCHIARL